MSRFGFRTRPGLQLPTLLGNPAAFLPSSVAGLRLWLDADDAATITESGGSVSQWDDKSGNNYHAASAINKRPTIVASVLNGKPVMRFNGTDQRFTFSGTALGMLRNVSAAYAFVVARDTLGTAAYRRLFFISTRDIGAGSGARGLFSMHTTATSAERDEFNVRRQANDSNAFLTANSVWGANTWRIVGHGINYATRAGVVRVDGVEAAANALLTAATGSTDDADSVEGIIGSTGDTSGQYWQGDLAEVAVYTSAPSSDDIASLEDYFSGKWGITLA